jgi:hypothetical protein
MKSKFLVFLLILSLVANAYFVLVGEQPSVEKKQVQEMQTHINNLQKENEDIRAQINQNNKSGIKGFATLQGPAVFRAIQPDSTIAEEGAMVNFSVEI